MKYQECDFFILETANFQPKIMLLNKELKKIWPFKLLSKIPGKVKPQI